MKKLLLIITALTFVIACNSSTQKQEDNKESSTNITTSEKMIKPDIYSTNIGDLKISLIGHASLMFEFDNKIIHIDPYSNVADYSKLPKADLIMLTHEHGDHLDTSAINLIKKSDTRFIVSKSCYDILGFGDIIKNEENTVYDNIAIDAVPAYNIEHKKADGSLYHPKGVGNGYIFTFGDKKVYVAGDSENIPEMDKLKGTIDIAFLPKNLPYTMSDEMFIDAAKKILPKHLYPYHLSEYDDSKISTVLSENNIEVLVRPMSNK